MPDQSAENNDYTRYDFDQAPFGESPQKMIDMR